jgi:hypothetical protein
MIEPRTRNPYGPGSDRKVAPARRAPSKRPVGFMIAAGLQAWTAVYIAWSAKGSVREIRAAFEARGIALPDEIHLLFAVRWPWWLLAALAVAQLVWVLASSTDEPTPVQKRRMKTSLWIFGVAFGAVFGWAAYELFALVVRLSEAAG